jgi:sulfonate transport system substrate-binding protein
MSWLFHRWALLFAAGALLASCSGAKEDSVTVLRVADQMHVLQSALAASGEDKPKGYRIQWSNFVGGPNVIAAQTGGSVDLGWMAETPLVFAQAAGSPVKVVAVSQGTRPGSSNVALVVAANSPVRSVAELKGKKVGYGAGTITQYLLVRLLEEQGLSLDDITPVRIASLSTASLGRSVDAYTTGEPMLSQDLAAGRIRVLSYGGKPHTPGFGYLVASDKALADQKRVAAMGDFAVRIARATRWQRDNVAKAAPVTAKAYNVSPQIAEQILRRTPIRYTPIDPSIVAEHQQEADQFLKLGLIRKRVDAAQLFDSRYNALIGEVEGGK